MGKETAISWADHSASPWVGCSVAHTGCSNCYARDFSQKKHGKVRGPWALWGPGQDRLVTKGFWTDAPKWARAAARDGVRRTIFPSLMDPLDAEVYERAEAPPGVACRATFDRFMQTIRVTGEVCASGHHGCGRVACGGFGGLTYLLLTKRPENWRWIPEDVRRFCWLLYSASDQPSLDAGMPHLLAAEGFAGLGLSLEPLVGPVRELSRPRQVPGSVSWFDTRRGPDGQLHALIDWVIIGGESGHNARPCDVAWIRDIVRQCREAGVSPYVKQLGARIHWGAFGGYSSSNMQSRAFGGIAHSAGADPSEWPTDVQVQEWPEGLR